MPPWGISTPLRRNAAPPWGDATPSRGISMPAWGNAVPPWENSAQPADFSIFSAKTIKFLISPAMWLSKGEWPPAAKTEQTF
jgi:hypothetical protein